VSTTEQDRGIDIELLAPEIEALQEAALHFARAVAANTGVGGAGLDLETAATCYVRKLDAERWKASLSIDPTVLAQLAASDKDPSGN
jgi:hypothetical protein